MATPAVEFTVIGIDKASKTFDDVASSAERSSDKVRRSGEQSAAGFERAAEGADTVASKGAQAAGALSGLGDLIGGPFGTAMMVGGVAMQAAADAGDLLNVAVEGGKAAIEALKNSTLVQTIVSKAQAVSTGVVTAAQWAWNAAMNANPIGLIIAAIVLLIAGIVLLVKNWDTVKAAGAAAWEWIKGAWSSAATWMNTNVVQPVARFFSGLWDGVKGAWNGTVSFFEGIGSGIKNAFKGAFNSVARFWNDGPGKIGFTVPSWVPLVGGKKFEIPDIPYLATGGSISRGGWAVVGERGPELVNVPTGAQVYDNTTSRRMSGGAGGVTVAIDTFNAGGMTPDEVGEALAWAARR